MGLRGGDLNLSPGRDATGVKMPTLEGLHKHTHTHAHTHAHAHALHVNAGPIFCPRHSSSWRLALLSFDNCTQHSSRHKRPEGQPHSTRRWGRGWLLEGHGHPFSPRLFDVAFLAWLSRAAPTDRHTERTLAFCSCQDTAPPTPLTSPVRDKATLWPQDRSRTAPWMGSPRLLEPRRKTRAALPSRGTLGPPEPLWNILPAPPA